MNTIQDVAQRIGNANVDVVTEALQESTQRITGPAYMTAGMGDGGPCHPRDNIALRWLAWRLELGYDLFAAIGNSREHQAEHIAEFLVALARDGGWREIWLHGEAFKPGLDCLEGSYSRLIAHFIRARGMTVSYIDPRTRPSVRSVRGVVLLAHNAEIAHDYDAGRSKPQFYCQFEPGCVLVHTLASDWV